MGWFRQTGEDALLRIKVTPGARHTQITDLVESADGPRLAVRVQAPPDKSKGNKAVCALIAETLGLAKNRVTISQGEKTRLKTLHIAGPLPASPRERLVPSPQQG